MKKQTGVIVAITILVVVLIYALSTGSQKNLTNTLSCNRDADCVEFCDRCTTVAYASIAKCGPDNPDIVLTCVCRNNGCSESK